MRISAVVCTNRRAEVLHRALESLASQTLDHSEFEVIVVFDQRDAETAGVVNDYEDELINLHRVDDDGRGLSNARNVGYEEADGEYVAFIDDDARADHDWLEAYLRSFDDLTPTPDCMGGPVRPEFESAVPRWMPSSFPGLPIRDFGDEPRWLSFPEDRVIGTNMAFPRRFLEETGGFPTDLGRKHGTLLSNEETVLQAKAAKGSGIFYDPAAGVEHLIPAKRMTMRYLLARHYWQGISDCRVDPATYAATDEPVGRSLREGLPRAVRVLGGHLLSGELKSYVMAGFWFAYIAGYVRERVAKVSRPVLARP